MEFYYLPEGHRAIHPVTTKPWNKTGSMNCNFMFYSELFNFAVFGLFKDGVNMNFYPKRLEKLAKIMETAFPKGN